MKGALLANKLVQVGSIAGLVRFACRLEAIADFSVLQVNGEVEALAREYFAALNIPEKAKIDAFHLAVAAWHRMDYVLSWNCKHIASGRVQKMLQDTNARLGIYTPIVCTPEELMEV